MDFSGKKVFQWTVIGERTVPIDQCDYDVDPQQKNYFYKSQECLTLK